MAQPHRKPGRKGLSDETPPSAPVTLRLAPKEYDQLDERARRERITLPELIRAVRPGGQQLDIRITSFGTPLAYCPRELAAARGAATPVVPDRSADRELA